VSTYLGVPSYFNANKNNGDVYQLCLSSSCVPIDLGMGVIHGMYDLSESGQMIPIRSEHYNPPALTLRCQHCGVKATEHEKFCVGCGAPL
jgi:hypothetical protein